jgi:alanine racemase
MACHDLRRPNVFEIDLGAFAHNLAEVRRVVGAGTRIFAALKADAYGFGLGEVARVVADGGGDAIAVADMADGVRLREDGIRLPILLYAGPLSDPESAHAAAAFDLMPTVLDRASAEAWSAAAGAPLGVFVKVDVGLERLGVEPERAADLVRHARRLPNLEVRGLYTHLHVPGGDGDGLYIDWQLGRFRAVWEALRGDGEPLPLRMAASSAVLRYTAEASLDAVDPGHVLFGLRPPGPGHVALDLRPVFRSLTSRLVHVRRIERTAFRERAPIPIRDGLVIGVLPIGLRDGMARLSCGEVLVRGRRVPVLGGFSLEHTRLDLSRVPDAAVGDEAVIIGRQGTAEITPQEVFQASGLSVEPALAMAVRESVRRRFVGAKEDS